MKRDIALSVIVSGLLVFAIVPSLASPFHSYNEQNALDFHLTDLSNATHSLSDYRGSIVVLDFFSVECSDCAISAQNVLVPMYQHYSSGDPKVQFPSIETSGASADAVNSTYLNYSSGDPKVQFLSIETSGASADTVNSTYLNSTGITWPILVGGDNLKNWPSTNAKPVVYVIDPEGKIVVSMTHPLEMGTLKATIDELLASNLKDASEPTRDDDRYASPTPTATPSPTPSPTPTEPTRNTHSSDAKQSNDATASSPTSSTLVAAAPRTSNMQEGNGASVVLFSPSLFTPIVPTSILEQASAMSAEAAAISQGATSCGVVVPAITLPALNNGVTSLPTQSVFEFSLLGLAAPLLLVAGLYLMLRRV